MKKRQIIIPDWNFNSESEPGEIWQYVNGFEGLYEISSLGRMKTHHFSHLKEPRIVTPKVTRKGYLTYRISKNNITKSSSAHRFVAKAFIVNPNNFPQINHINGIKTDNSVPNLEWCTNQYNMDHAIRTGLMNNRLKGEDNPRAILTEAVVMMIRHGEFKDMQTCEIARKLGYNWSTVDYVRKYKSWKHVA